MTASINPENWLDEYGDFLYRYALLRTNNVTLAEDLVQETFLAALAARERFAGLSKERTWLTAILKHKIIDHFRKSARETPLDDASSESASVETFFDERGRWLENSSDWGNPEKSVEQKAFWEAFNQCISKLPEPLADLYVLREMHGLSSEEVCYVLKISTTNNMWVMLSRARMRLRHCLERRWFNSLQR